MIGIGPAAAAAGSGRLAAPGGDRRVKVKEGGVVITILPFFTLTGMTGHCILNSPDRRGMVDRSGGTSGISGTSGTSEIGETSETGKTASIDLTKNPIGLIGPIGPISPIAIAPIALGYPHRT